MIWYIVPTMQLPEKLAFVDIETTGGRALSDRIIEIGIVRVENNKVVHKYQTLLNPDTYVSPFVEQLTGITTKDLEHAPTFYEVKDEILEALDDSIFVAHNVRFDYGFLKNEFKRHLVDFSAKHFCTVKLSRTLFPDKPHHNLDAIIERFGIACDNRHRALGDAQVLWEFYSLLQKHVNKEVLTQAVHTALKRPSRPINITEEAINALPETPGVYIFQDKVGAPLYIGKSINIRDRVLSHFSSDTESTRERELSEQTHHIETITTAGELSALFLESKLIKELQPLYNRKLRYKRKLHVLCKNIDDKGYETVTLKEMERINVDDLNNILAIVRSKKQANSLLHDLAKQYTLCTKVLGVESTSTSCFAYRLGWCKGACVGKEKPLTYNLRMITAFSEYKIMKWPFSGPILIHEENVFNEKAVGYVFDNWCYLGDCESDTDCDIKNNYEFDHDMYKILVQFLKNPKNYKKIKVLSYEQISLNKSPI